MATVGTVLVDVKADTTHLVYGMKKAQTQMKQVGENAKDLAKVFGGLVIVDIFKNQIKQTLDYADSLSKLSQKTGVGTSELYSLSAAAKLSDVDFESLQTSLSKFSKAIGETSMGSGDAQKAFERLGISVKNSDGTIKDSFDLLGEISDKFKDMPDGASKATTAIELFGKSGAAMIPLLNGGKASLEEYLGVMNDKTGKAAEAFNDSMTKIGVAFQSLHVKIISELSPSLLKLSEDFDSAAKAKNGWIDKVASGAGWMGEKLIETGYVVDEVFKNYKTVVGGYYDEMTMRLKGNANEADAIWDKTKEKLKQDAIEMGDTIAKLRGTYLDPSDANLISFKIKSGEVKPKNNLDFGLVDTEKAKAEAKKLADEYQQAFESISQDIAKLTMDDYNYGVFLINKKVEKSRKAGIEEVEIEEFVMNSKMELGIKQLAEETKQKEEYTKQLGTELTDATKKYQTYYETMGDYATSWEIKRLELAQEYSMLNEEQLDGFLAKQQQSYIKSFEKQKSEAELAAEAMYQAFHGIERQLTNSFMDFFDYTSKGFGDFGTLAKNVLNQVIAEMIRMSIVAPIVGRAATATSAGTGLTGLFGGLFANGGAFDNGIQAFATGGVVSSPTLFPMAKGTGLMGEAGPEAIMPLTRIGGSLGVKATGGNTYINVQNESGMPVDMKELSRTQNDRGDEVINIVMKAAVYNPDFRAALGMSR